MYILKDKQNTKFKIVGTLENIQEFLAYPINLNYIETKYRLKDDIQYHTKEVDYYIEETRVHVAERMSGNIVADVKDINQGLAVIELFETEDDGNEEYEPGYYDVVDDDHNSLL